MAANRVLCSFCTIFGGAPPDPDKSATVPTETGRLLLVDDDEYPVKILASQLEVLGHQVTAMTDAAAALAAYDALVPEVVIVDLWMHELSGMDVLAEIRRRDPAASVILLSGSVDVPTTVRALRAGAEDVLTKPANLDHLGAAIERGLQRSRLFRTHRAAATQLNDPYGFFDDSPPMRRVTRQLEQLSQVTLPVLIIGEPGTGKRVVAEMLHQLSPRGSGPFVHVASAGDGAPSKAQCAAAVGGTLFLDSVGGLSERAQELLLALLGPTGGGSNEPAPAVRVVASTARDLAEEMRAGTLRPELYQRLTTLPLAVPSLRSRGDDAIRGLALRALQSLRFSLGRGPLHLSDEAFTLLCSLSWPGNVRQLRDVIEESFFSALADEVLEPRHLRVAIERSGLETPAAAAARGDQSLEHIERQHIARVLAQTGGHRTEAARILGITRTTLYKKMDAYGLTEVGGD